MCGRYALRSSLPEIARILGIEVRVASPSNDPPRYNIAPTQSVPVICQQENGEFVAQSMRWGLIPSWTKTLNNRYLMINARAETLKDKPSFRLPYRQQRCLIPADGYYEWQKTDTGKAPYYFRRRDEGPFYFAGLWESWRKDDQQTIQSCTIVTTQANAELAHIHHRSPVILDSADLATWLDVTVTDTRRLDNLLRPCDIALIDHYRVSNLVNSVRNDTSQCIERLISG